MNGQHDIEVAIVGAGGAGLACAAELGARGVRSVVLERGPGPGTSWAERYDGLRLNTSRRISQMQGAPFPEDWGQYPTGSQLADYLQRYAADHDLAVRPGTVVSHIDRADDGWLVRIDGDGPLQARHVVVATGMYHTPKLPAWSSPADFRGRLLHSSEYRNATPFAGRDALVVGAGASAMEIAHELVVGGATRVRVAVRTPPNLLLRKFQGRPPDAALPLLLRLPIPVADLLAAVMRRVTIGDLSAFGLPRPRVGPFRALQQRKAATSVEPATLDDLRAGRIVVVAPVVDVTADGVSLADGSVLDIDLVIAATGFTTGLGPVVGHLDVLDAEGVPQVGDGRESLPGLRFIGYEFVPGVIALAADRAVRVAEEISRDPSTARRVSARPAVP